MLIFVNDIQISTQKSLFISLTVYLCTHNSLFMNLSAAEPFVSCFNDADHTLSAACQIICTVRKHILTGGPKRLPFTVPPLIFNALKV